MVASCVDRVFPAIRRYGRLAAHICGEDVIKASRRRPDAGWPPGGAGCPQGTARVHTFAELCLQVSERRCTKAMRPLPRPEVFDRSEALGAGWTDSALRHAVRSGRIRRIRSGRFSPTATTPDDPRAAALLNARLAAIAAQRACRGSVLSHASAAIVHGLPLLGPVPIPPTVTVPPNGTGDLVRASLHRATLADRDVVVRDGVPVTSVARTLVDLGRSSSIASAVVVADAALHGGMVTASELDAVLIRCWNWC